LALLASGFSDVRGYMMAPGDPEGTTSAFANDDIGTWCAHKRTALEAYKLWDPNVGRYAIGFHSVPTLWDERATTCLEYVVVP
jgi:hypothetical protein